jgi:hypothetical protein
VYLEAFGGANMCKSACESAGGGRKIHFRGHENVYRGPENKIKAVVTY